MAFNTPIVDNEIPSAAKWNQAVAAYDRSTSAVDVVNTTTETTVYSKSIGAGHMSSDRMLRLTLLGDYLNNAGTTNFTLRVKFGGSTIYGNAISGIAADADRLPFVLQLWIGNLGSASSNYMVGQHAGFAAPAAGSISGLTASATIVTFGSTGLTAINTASAQTLEVTAQHVSASTSISFRKHYTMLELL